MRKTFMDLFGIAATMRMRRWPWLLLVLCVIITSTQRPASSSFVSAATSNQERAASLAMTRINDALVELSGLIKDGFLDLAGKCKANLQSVQDGLIEAGQLLENGRVDDATEELNVVINLLDACLDSLAKPVQDDASATALVDVRATLRRVSSSVSSAQELLAIASPNMNTLSNSYNTNTNNNINNNVNSNWPGNVVMNPKPNSEFVPERTPSSRTYPPQAPNKPTFMVDYCPNHVTMQSNSAIVLLDQSCGAKLHSNNKYSSGLFSARIRTAVKGTGIINNFYISSNDQASDLISFDFIGRYPNRVLTSYSVNGNSGGNQQLFVLAYDTSVDFHTYTIKWDSDSIMWLADNVVLRTLYRSNVSTSYPQKPTHIFFHTWDASNVADGTYAGKVNWTFGPFRSYFTDVTASSPLISGSWKAPVLASDAALSLVPIPMRPLSIDYCFSNVAVAGNDISITYDQQGCGGRFRSITTYPSGTFTGRVKCAAGDTSGLLSSLYLSSLEGSKVQDEIDFEWLGKDKNSVQTNYYVNGVGGHEVQVALGFDCSRAYHTYTIMYSYDQIQWLVDGSIVRIVTRAKEAMFNRPYPVKPVYFYASVWNASAINGGTWSGKWHGTNMPYTVYFSDVRIKSPF